MNAKSVKLVKIFLTHTYELFSLLACMSDVLDLSFDLSHIQNITFSPSDLGPAFIIPHSPI